MTTEEATSKEKKEVSPCHTHLSIRQLFRSIDQAIVNMPNVADLEPLDLLATRIIPEVEKMEVAGR